VDGFLNLNKPAGLTSHDCVARVRKLLKLKRVGHGGTLDPAATGVLPIALGRATRLLQFLQQGKAYRATVRFGVRTATDDLEGDILAAQSVPWLELDAVKAILPKFQGEIQQIPPSYSAIQVGGKRLYDLARAGEAVQAPVRTVQIYQIDVLDWRSQEFPELDIAIACGSGTYIRAIARDLGEMLNTGATLAALRRTESAGFTLDTSLTLDEFAAQVQDQRFQPIAPAIVLTHLPAVTLPALDAKRWCQGQRFIDQDGVLTGEPGIRRVLGTGDRFLGIGNQVNTAEGVLLVPQLVFEVAA
jgi:tRNA pseudouridine55 synthase